MSKLWTPPSVAPELREATANATADLKLMVRRDGGSLADWNRVLRQADPYMELVQAYEKAEWPGLIPGFYHLVRWNPGAPPSVMPLRGPDGGFVEPSSQMLDLLRQSDLQNVAAVHARRLADEEAERARERDRERRREEMDDEVLARWKAASRTQVSMNPDVPWTQNASAASRRDREARKAKKDS